MIRSASVLVCLGMSILLTAQVKLPKKVNQNVVAIEEWPGVMMDQTEVTLGDWFAFIASKKVDDLMFLVDDYLPIREAIPDKLHHAFDKMVTLFTDVYAEDVPMKTGIGNNSWIPLDFPDDQEVQKAMNFPVTGVTVSQIEEYMEWRRALMANDSRVIKLGLEVKARLIKPEEFDELAKYSGSREPTNKTIHPDTVNAEGCYLMNIRYEEPCESTLKAIELHGEGAYPVASYFADKNGLYDLFGNVAEMTSVHGVAKGGSFEHWGSEAFSGKEIHYYKTKPWLGFRVLFEFK